MSCTVGPGLESDIKLGPAPSLQVTGTYCQGGFLNKMYAITVNPKLLARVGFLSIYNFPTRMWEPFKIQSCFRPLSKLMEVAAVDRETTLSRSQIGLVSFPTVPMIRQRDFSLCKKGCLQGPSLNRFLHLSHPGPN